MERRAETVRALLEVAERVRLAELQRWTPKLSSLTSEQQQAVEELTRAITAAVFAPAVMSLRDGDKHANAASVLADLWSLDPLPDSPGRY